MNISMHGVQATAAKASKGTYGVKGWVELAESEGRNSTGDLFFYSADDCQAMADKLAELAEQMRALESEREVA